MLTTAPMRNIPQKATRKPLLQNPEKESTWPEILMTEISKNMIAKIPRKSLTLRNKWQKYPRFWNHLIKIQDLGIYLQNYYQLNTKKVEMQLLHLFCLSWKGKKHGQIKEDVGKSWPQTKSCLLNGLQICIGKKKHCLEKIWLFWFWGNFCWKKIIIYWLRCCTLIHCKV